MRLITAAVLGTIAGCVLSTRQPGTALSGCGDRVVDSNEICDDGNRVSGDGCAADCDSDESCGNGVLDRASGEVCDDGGQVGGDACAADCRSDETCGNGVTDVGAGESCDDGNSVDGDGCSAVCQVNALCGNLSIDPNEDCDRGPGFHPDCDPDCTLPECGDGAVNMLAGEQCDDHNTIDTDACLSSCRIARCGDGVIRAGVEYCDDGNVADGDGCSSSCFQERCDNGC